MGTTLASLFWVAINKQAKALGLPKHFRRDLSHYDRGFIVKQADEPGGWDGQPYVWGIYDCGTLIQRADHKDLATFTREAHRLNDGKVAWFVWESGSKQLRGVTCEEAIRWAAERAEEMKQAMREPLPFRHYY